MQLSLFHMGVLPLPIEANRPCDTLSLRDGCPTALVVHRLEGFR